MPVAIGHAEAAWNQVGRLGGYAAIGASLRYVASNATTLDFIRTRRRRGAPHGSGSVFAAGALAIFFGLTGLYRTAAAFQKSKELAQFHRDPEIEAVFANKTPADIDKLIAQMQAQNRTSTVVYDPLKATQLLADIVNAMPENMWITSIKFRSPIARMANEAFEIEILGKAVGPTMSAEQDMAFKFRDRLLNTSVLGKTFPEIQVSVNGRPIEENQPGNLTAEQLRQRLEERTTFSLTMRKLI